MQPQEDDENSDQHYRTQYNHHKMAHSYNLKEMFEGVVPLL